MRTDYALRSRSAVLCQTIGLDLSSGIKEIGGEQLTTISFHDRSVQSSRVHAVTGCAMSDVIGRSDLVQV